VRLLTKYEIDLVAGGWGTTGETLDGMLLDKDSEIVVTGRRPTIMPGFGFNWGYAGPDFGGNYADGGGNGFGRDFPLSININIDLDKVLPLEVIRNGVENVLTNKNQETTNNLANSKPGAPLDPHNYWLQSFDGKLYGDLNKDGKYDAMYTDRGFGRWTVSFDGGATSTNMSGPPNWVNHAYGG